MPSRFSKLSYLPNFITPGNGVLEQHNCRVLLYWNWNKTKQNRAQTRKLPVLILRFARNLWVKLLLLPVHSQQTLAKISTISRGTNYGVSYLKRKESQSRRTHTASLTKAHQKISHEDFNFFFKIAFQHSAWWLSVASLSFRCYTYPKWAITSKQVPEVVRDKTIKTDISWSTSSLEKAISF